MAMDQVIKHGLELAVGWDDKSQKRMRNAVRNVFTEEAHIDFANPENIQGLKVLGEMMRKIFTQAGEKKFDFEKIMGAKDASQMFAGLKDAAMEFDRVWESLVANMGSFSFKDMFMRDAGELSMALQRISDKNGKIIKANIKDIQRAFEEVTEKDQNKLFNKLLSAEKSIEGARTWEARTAAALEYVNTYEKILKITELEGINVDKRDKALLRYAQDSLDPKHKVADIYSIDAIREALPQMQTSLQNIFNMAMGKALVGLTDGGVIDVNVSPVVINKLDVGDLFNKKMAGGEIGVSVVPEIDPQFQEKLSKMWKANKDSAISGEAGQKASDAFYEYYDEILQMFSEDMEEKVSARLDKFLKLPNAPGIRNAKAIWKDFLGFGMPSGGTGTGTGFGTGAGVGTGDASSAELAALQKQLTDKEAELASIREEFEATQRSINAYDTQLNQERDSRIAAEKREAELNAEIETLRQQISNMSVGGLGSGVGDNALQQLQKDAEAASKAFEEATNRLHEIYEEERRLEEQIANSGLIDYDEKIQAAEEAKENTLSALKATLSKKADHKGNVDEMQAVIQNMIDKGALSGISKPTDLYFVEQYMNAVADYSKHTNVELNNLLEKAVSTIDRKTKETISEYKDAQRRQEEDDPNGLIAKRRRLAEEHAAASKAYNDAADAQKAAYDKLHEAQERGGAGAGDGAGLGFGSEVEESIERATVRMRTYDEEIRRAHEHMIKLAKAGASIYDESYDPFDDPLASKDFFDDFKDQDGHIDQDELFSTLSRKFGDVEYMNADGYDGYIRLTQTPELIEQIEKAYARLEEIDNPYEIQDEETLNKLYLERLDLIDRIGAENLKNYNRFKFDDVEKANSYYRELLEEMKAQKPDVSVLSDAEIEDKLTKLDELKRQMSYGGDLNYDDPASSAPEYEIKRLTKIKELYSELTGEKDGAAIDVIQRAIDEASGILEDLKGYKELLKYDPEGRTKEELTDSFEQLARSRMRDLDTSLSSFETHIPIETDFASDDVIRKHRLTSQIIEPLEDDFYETESLEEILNGNKQILVQLEKENLLTEEMRAKYDSINNAIAERIQHQKDYYAAEQAAEKAFDKISKLDDEFGGTDDPDKANAYLEERKRILSEISELVRDNYEESIEQATKENTLIERRIALLRDAKAGKINIDDIDVIMQETGDLESRLEQLHKVSTDWGLNIKDEDALEDDDAQDYLKEFEETYDRIIVKLADGKDVEILPNAEGLRKLQKYFDLVDLEGDKDIWKSGRTTKEITGVEFVRKEMQQISQEVQRQAEVQVQANDAEIESNKEKIKSYEELSASVSRYIELAKSLVDTENNTKEHQQIERDKDSVDEREKYESKDYYINAVNKQQRNISKIKSAIKNSSSSYTDDDGDEYRIVEDTLKEAESKLRGYIYHYARGFEDISALVDGAQTKSLKTLINKEVGKFKADEEIQRQQEEIAEAANAAALAEMERIEQTIEDSAPTEKFDEVFNTLGDLKYRAHQVDRYTQSVETDNLADAIGIISPHKAIENNAKAIESYEELCRVVERYNELTKENYIYSGGKEHTPSEDEENEIAELEGRLNATREGVKITYREVSGNINKLAQLLGIEIPKAAQQAETAVAELNRELKTTEDNTDDIGKPLGDSSGADTDTSQTDGTTSDEIKNLNDVRDAVGQITANVKKKTQEFLNEQSAVKKVSDSEVHALGEVEKKVTAIRVALSNVNTLLNNIKKGNDISQLSDIKVTVNYPKQQNDYSQLIGDIKEAIGRPQEDENENNDAEARQVKTIADILTRIKLHTHNTVRQIRDNLIGTQFTNLKSNTYNVKIAHDDSDKSANKVAINTKDLEAVLRRVFTDKPGTSDDSSNATKTTTGVDVNGVKTETDALIEQYRGILKTIEEWKALYAQLKTIEASGTTDFRKQMLPMLENMSPELVKMVGTSFAEDFANGFKGVKTKDIVSRLQYIAGADLLGSVTDQVDMLSKVDFSTFSFDGLEIKETNVEFLKEAYELLQKIDEKKKEIAGVGTSANIDADIATERPKEQPALKKTLLSVKGVLEKIVANTASLNGVEIQRAVEKNTVATEGVAPEVAKETSTAATEGANNIAKVIEKKRTDENGNVGEYADNRTVVRGQKTSNSYQTTKTHMVPEFDEETEEFKGYKTTLVEIIDDFDKIRKENIKAEKDLVRAQKKVSEFLAKFQSKTGGNAQYVDGFSQLQNMAEHIDTSNIDIAYNKMIELQQKYAELERNFRKGQSSLNPFVNAINRSQNIGNIFGEVEDKFNGLVVKSDELTKNFTRLKSLSEQIQTFTKKMETDPKSIDPADFTNFSQWMGDFTALKTQVDSMLRSEKAAEKEMAAKDAKRAKDIKNLASEYEKLGRLRATFEGSGDLEDKEDWTILSEKIAAQRESLKLTSAEIRLLQDKSDAAYLEEKRLIEAAKSQEKIDQIKKDADKAAEQARKDAEKSRTTHNAQVEAEIVKELIKLYEQLGKAQATGNEDEASRLRGTISLERGKLSSIDYATDMKFKDAKSKGFETERASAEKDALKAEEERVKKLNKLYQEYGVLQERANAATGHLRAQLDKEIIAKNEEIKALERSLSSITSEMSAGFNKAQELGKALESRKQLEAQARKSDADEATRLKNIAALEKEIGKLKAEKVATSDVGVQEALNKEIELRQTLIGLQKQGLALTAEAEAYQRQEAANRTKQARVEAAKQNRDVERDSKKQAAEAKRKAKREAMFGKAGNAIGRAENLWMSAQGEDKLPKDLIAQVDALYDKMVALRAKQDEVRNAKTATPEQQKALRNQTIETNKLTNEVSELFAEYQRLSGANVDETKTKTTALTNKSPLASYETELKQYVRTITDGEGQITGFNAATKTLTYTVKTGRHEFTEYTAAVRHADNALVSVQGTTKRTETFFEATKRKMKELTSYMSGMAIFSRVTQEIRQGIQYVREIDLALTELKKVTDETEETYDRFLETAAKTGARLGTTISAVTEATATFAKLGYTMAQATEMAEAAIVYKNVGDNIESTGDAADSIISTMKGFRLEATESMAIVDRFNEVGNRFAITSQGIGEALRLSASALSEGGNSLDESIGLITAAM